MQHLYTLLFFLLSFIFVKASPDYQMAEASAVVPVQIRNKLILVEGKINNQAGYFLFDTGASELILNEARFPRHEHHHSVPYFADATGHVAAHGYTYISTFNWGGLHREGFFAPLLDLLALESNLGEQLLGIIGYDVLQHVDLELDYYQGTISLFRPGAVVPYPEFRVAPDYTFDFEMDRHLPVLKAAVGNADGLLLAIDSGSSVNICDSRLKGKLKKKALQKRTIGLQGAVGILQQSPFYVMEALRIENTYSIAYCRVALSNLKKLKDHGIRIDGLLGINFFRLGRVFFSYHTQRIMVWLGQNEYTLRHSSLQPLPEMSAK
ncbi:MAG: hypothetical protein KDD01_10470 [Phaeodactylibacter sp.]|nr:hypothetical protein [Phaeodactylibacter sp.]